MHQARVRLDMVSEAFRTTIALRILGAIQGLRVGVVCSILRLEGLKFRSLARHRDVDVDEDMYAYAYTYI